MRIAVTTVKCELVPWNTYEIDEETAAVGHSSLAASSLNELLVAWSSPDVHSWD
ncbi:unnamed protein product, partial [Didymodactylos carnosus]